MDKHRRKRCRETPHPLIEKAGIRAASESSNTHEETGATSKSCISLTKLGVGKKTNTLDFRFLFAYSAGGRGNGKRVARRLHCRSGSHEPACGKQDGRRPLKVPSRKRGEGSAARRSLDSE